MARVKNLFFSDMKNFSPEKLEEILSVVRKLEKLPPIKPFDNGDRRKISERNIKYITSEYSDKREVYEVSDHSKHFVYLKRDDTCFTGEIGVARYTIKNSRLVAS